MIDFANGTMVLEEVITELQRQGCNHTTIVDMLNNTVGHVENGVNYVEVKGLEKWMNNENSWMELCCYVVMACPEC